MPREYLIPDFIVDYLQSSKSKKTPQRLVGILLNKNLSPEIKQWFNDNKVTAGYLWKNFVFFGLTKFSFKVCPICNSELSIKQILEGNVYCSPKCSSQSKEVCEKRKRTCKEKYGVSFVSQSEKIKEKKRETAFKHYGVENIFQAKEVKEKIRRTNILKYGKEQYVQSNEYKEKHRSDFWDIFCLRLKEGGIEPLFAKEEYITDKGRAFGCLLCGEKFISDGLSYDNRFEKYYALQTHHIYCPNCSRLFSKKEKDVLGFIKTVYGGEILENVRGLFPVKNMELDIYLPQLNIGIEFDGTYWHSTTDAKKRDNHKNKLCEQKGIRLLRIKESDWDNDKESVEKEIKSFLGFT